MPYNLPDYPGPAGSKNQGVYVVPGPASYTQVTPGTPVTGGQVVTAADLGLKAIEFAVAMGGSDGTHEVVLAPTANGDRKTGFNSLTLIWKLAATGAQAAAAANLSTKFVRLYVIGN